MAYYPGAAHRQGAYRPGYPSEYGRWAGGARGPPHPYDAAHYAYDHRGYGRYWPPAVPVAVRYSPYPYPPPYSMRRSANDTAYRSAAAYERGLGAPPWPKYPAAGPLSSYYTTSYASPYAPRSLYPPHEGSERRCVAGDAGAHCGCPECSAASAAGPEPHDRGDRDGEGSAGSASESNSAGEAEDVTEPRVDPPRSAVHVATDQARAGWVLPSHPPPPPPPPPPVVPYRFAYGYRRPSYYADSRAAYEPPTDFRRGLPSVPSPRRFTLTGAPLPPPPPSTMQRMAPVTYDYRGDYRGQAGRYAGDLERPEITFVTDGHQVCRHPGCGRTFASFVRMQMHMRVHRPEPQGPVAERPPESRESRELRESAPRRHSRGAGAACPFRRGCAFVSHNSFQLADHILTVHRAWRHAHCPFDCGLRPSPYWTSSSFEQHVLNHCRELLDDDAGHEESASPSLSSPEEKDGVHRRDVQASSDDESPAAGAQRSLAIGNVTGTRMLVFVCRWARCGAIYSKREHLSRHLTELHAMTTHGGVPVRCEWPACSYVARTSSDAAHHCLLHVQPTACHVYPCAEPGCGKIFATKHDLCLHAREYVAPASEGRKRKGDLEHETPPKKLRAHAREGSGGAGDALEVDAPSGARRSRYVAVRKSPKKPRDRRVKGEDTDDESATSSSASEIDETDAVVAVAKPKGRGPQLRGGVRPLMVLPSPPDGTEHTPPHRRATGRRIVLFPEDPNAAPVEVFLNDNGAQVAAGEELLGRRRRSARALGKGSSRRKCKRESVRRWAGESSAAACVRASALDADELSDADLSDGVPVLPVRLVAVEHSDTDDDSSEEGDVGGEGCVACRDGSKEDLLHCSVCLMAYHEGCLDADAVGRVLRAHWTCPGCREQETTKGKEPVAPTTRALSVNTGDVRRGFRASSLVPSKFRLAYDDAVNEWLVIA